MTLRFVQPKPQAIFFFFSNARKIRWLWLVAGLALLNVNAALRIELIRRGFGATAEESDIRYSAWLWPPPHHDEVRAEAEAAYRIFHTLGAPIKIFRSDWTSKSASSSGARKKIQSSVCKPTYTCIHPLMCVSIHIHINIPVCTKMKSYNTPNPSQGQGTKVHVNTVHPTQVSATATWFPRQQVWKPRSMCPVVGKRKKKSRGLQGNSIKAGTKVALQGFYPLWATCCLERGQTAERERERVRVKERERQTHSSRACSDVTRSGWE